MATLGPPAAALSEDQQHRLEEFIEEWMFTRTNVFERSLPIARGALLVRRSRAPA